MSEQDLLKNKWEPIIGVDYTKRTPLEWAKIYNIELLSNLQNVLWNEYEWAYNFSDLQYYPVPDKHGECEKTAEMELRALELRRDIFMGADIGERHLLEKEGKYIETDWIRKREMLN